MSVAAAALLVMGCGLSEYERGLEEQQKRLAYLAEENKSLGGPVKFKDRPKASGEEEPQPAPEMFLRLPRGIRDVGQPFPKSVLYRFGPESAKASGVDEVYVGQGAHIQKDVLDQLQRLLGLPAPQPQPEKVLETLDGQQLRFTVLSAVVGKRPMTYLIYFYESSGSQVALIYREPPPKDDAGSPAGFDPRIEYSLKSLALGAAMARKRRLYQGP